MSYRRREADVPAVPVDEATAGASAETGLAPDEVARLKWMRIGEFLDILDDDTPA